MIPRNGYPRPQLVRKDWLCLNGEWDFMFDNERSGIEKDYLNKGAFDRKITVPFCPESPLSGIGVTDFINAVWYKKTFTVPKEWEGKDILLHFGAVDYKATVFVNGRKVGSHKGGYTPFAFNVTDFLVSGDNTVVLYAEDDTRSPNQPTGKQSTKYASYGCYYTRTTGIWQTVWLEPVEKTYIGSVNYVSDISAPSVSVTAKIAGDFTGKTLTIETSFEGKETGKVTLPCVSGCVTVTVPLSEKHLWEVGCGRLYDVKLTLKEDGKETDSVSSYFGLREVGLTGKAMTINGKTVFGRLVLDQGFYPDGIYTAPTAEALKNDIIYSMQLGFNGARLHEKVFEPEFLYFADKLGYIVWGEYPNWGLSLGDNGKVMNILPEWLEEVERDIAHPSIIGWCPYNETWGYKYNDNVKLVYLATKAADPTRPVIDTSGNYHVITDIFDVHDYEQDPDKFASYYADIEKGEVKDQIYRRDGKDAQVYKGEPLFMSEYGGIRWSEKSGWGYGKGPESEDEFLDRYRRLTEYLLFNKNFMGFCYTQLYDVEQEQNGLMTYEREFKFPPETIAAINNQKAAIED